MSRTATSTNRTKSVVRFVAVLLGLLVLSSLVVSQASAATPHTNPVHFEADPAVPTAPAPAAAPLKSGTIGIRLVDVPANAMNNPRAHVYIIDTVAPGATIKRRVQIINLSAAPMNVALYAAGATIHKQSFVGLVGNTQNEMSRWIALTTPAISLAPNANAMDLVTISVPADAAPGEQYATIWAEISSTKSGGIIEKNRVGLRVYLQVGGSNAPGPNFKINTLTAKRTASGAPTVIASVTNTGGRALDMSGTVTLAGQNGLNAGPFQVSVGTTIPVGSTQPVAVVLAPSIPAGPWVATMTLLSGDLTRSATATVLFPATGAAAPVIATPAPAAPAAAPVTAKSRWSWSWLRLVGLAALLALLLPWWLMRRRGRNDDDNVGPSAPDASVLRA